MYLTKDGKRWAQPYRCGSWRHAGACRTYNAHLTFARLHDRLAGADPAALLMVVLTLDQRELRQAWAAVEIGEALANVAGMPPEVRVLNADIRWYAFRSLSRRWQSLRQALHREADRRGIRRARWCMTVEVHRRGGWPHAHLLIEWPWLADELRREALAGHDCIRREHPAIRCGEDGCWRDWLSDHAEACGWGRVLSLDVAKSAGQAAGYMIKLAGEVECSGGAAGELAKTSQVPVEAPRHFRRLRYSLRTSELEAMLEPMRRGGAHGALCGCDCDDTADAIARGADLVDDVDADGVVTRVPFVLRGRGRSPPELYAAAVSSHRFARKIRYQAARAWLAENCPELL